MPGIVGNVDTNEFRGDAAALAALGKPGAAPAPVYAQPGDVGDGIIAAMAAAGTAPAMPSVFLPLGRSPALTEECMALDGTVYRWHIPSGRMWTYPPAA